MLPPVVKKEVNSIPKQLPKYNKQERKGAGKIGPESPYKKYFSVSFHLAQPKAFKSPQLRLQMKYVTLMPFVEEIINGLRHSLEATLC